LLVECDRCTMREILKRYDKGFDPELPARDVVFSIYILSFYTKHRNEFDMLYEYNVGTGYPIPLPDISDTMIMFLSTISPLAILYTNSTFVAYGLSEDEVWKMRRLQERYGEAYVFGIDEALSRLEKWLKTAGEHLAGRFEEYYAGIYKAALVDLNMSDHIVFVVFDEMVRAAWGIVLAPVSYDNIKSVRDRCNVLHVLWREVLKSRGYSNIVRVYSHGYRSDGGLFARLSFRDLARRLFSRHCTGDYCRLVEENADIVTTSMIDVDARVHDTIRVTTPTGLVYELTHSDLGIENPMIQYTADKYEKLLYSKIADVVLNKSEFTIPEKINYHVYREMTRSGYSLLPPGDETMPGTVTYTMTEERGGGDIQIKYKTTIKYKKIEENTSSNRQEGAETLVIDVRWDAQITINTGTRQAPSIENYLTGAIEHHLPRLPLLDTEMVTVFTSPFHGKITIIYMTKDNIQATLDAGENIDVDQIVRELNTQRNEFHRLVDRIVDIVLREKERYYQRVQSSPVPHTRMARNAANLLKRIIASFMHEIPTTNNQHYYLVPDPVQLDEFLQVLRELKEKIERSVITIDENGIRVYNVDVAWFLDKYYGDDSWLKTVALTAIVMSLLLVDDLAQSRLGIRAGLAALTSNCPERYSEYCSIIQLLVTHPHLENTIIPGVYEENYIHQAFRINNYNTHRDLHV